MKKINFKFAVLSFVLLAFLGFGQNAQADGEVLLNLSNITAISGEEAVLSLVQDSFTNFATESPASYTFRISFDVALTDSFRILPGGALGATPLKNISCLEISGGVYDCQISGDTANTIGDGQIAVLVFQLKNGLSDSTNEIVLSNVTAIGIAPDNNVIPIISGNGNISLDALAAPVSFNLSSGSGNRGDVVNLNLAINKTGVAESPEVLLWDVLFNSNDITAVSVSEIPAMQNAGVTVSCLLATTGDYKCSASGYSAIVENINNLAILQFTISDSTVATSIPVILTGAISIAFDYQPTQTTNGVITVTEPTEDVIAPIISSFIIPATATALTIPITEFTASDAVGVTGYLVRELNTTPTAIDASWENTATTTYTFSSAGSKTLFAWAKDTGGNVSASSSASIVITLPDITAPSVPTDLIATAVSTTGIDLSWSSSTDAVSVAGYKIFRNSTQIATSTTLSFSDTSLTAGTAYSYSVAAFDISGNESNQTVSVSATTQSNPTQTVSPSQRGGGGGGSRNVPVATSSNPTVLSAFSSAIMLPRTLSLGMSGNDVTTLQQFLIRNGYLQVQTTTNYFGTLTREAVKKFQCAKNIACNGTEATTGYGLVGKKTREAITLVSGNSGQVLGTNNINDLRLLLISLLKQVAELQAKLNALKTTN